MLDLQLAFTDDQVKNSVDDLGSDLFLLTLVGVIVPVVGIVGGLICIAVGILLLLRDRRQGGASSGSSQTPRTPAHV